MTLGEAQARDVFAVASMMLEIVREKCQGPLKKAIKQIDFYRKWEQDLHRLGNAQSHTDILDFIMQGITVETISKQTKLFANC